MQEEIIHIKCIAKYHNRNKLGKPQHPLISVINFEDIRYSSNSSFKVTHGFYCIALKHLHSGKMQYGQQEYDFDEGILAFLSPNQVMSVVNEKDSPLEHSGWLLIFHPDFLWNTTLVRKIKDYDFFSYELNEALHLSEKEEAMLLSIILNINEEYKTNIDKFSQDIIISQLELLLNYSDRFYQRQFYTRKKSTHTILEQFDHILSTYTSSDKKTGIGLPSVKEVAKLLNLSPNYLSRVLKTTTGKSTQEMIHEKLVHLAKEKLSTTNLHINQIAYELGFEHPQSFSKLFKKKTEMTPLEFRKTFN